MAFRCSGSWAVGQQPVTGELLGAAAVAAKQALFPAPARQVMHDPLCGIGFFVRRVL